MRRAGLVLLLMLVTGCGSPASSLPPSNGIPRPSDPPLSTVLVPVETPAASVNVSLQDSHEAACQDIASLEGGTWPDLVIGANRVLVLQTFDRPVHLYADATRLVVCIGTSGHTYFETYKLTELVDTRLEQARLNDLAALDLVTAMVCIHITQFGAFITCFGLVDPIVARASFRVPGIPADDAALGIGPQVSLGDASSNVWFLVQWPGEERYTGWSAFDSCGKQLGLIAMVGPEPTPTVCPPVR